jgi:hypothetical protein
MRAFLTNRTTLRIHAVFACAGLLFFCQSAESAKNRTAEKATPAAAAKAAAEKAAAVSDTDAAIATVTEARKLVVYYFHTTFRYSRTGSGSICFFDLSPKIEYFQ